MDPNYDALQRQIQMYQQQGSIRMQMEAEVAKEFTQVLKFVFPGLSSLICFGFAIYFIYYAATIKKVDGVRVNYKGEKESDSLAKYIVFAVLLLIGSIALIYWSFKEYKEYKYLV